jgi:hypothetical protein
MVLIREGCLLACLTHADGADYAFLLCTGKLRQDSQVKTFVLLTDGYFEHEHISILIILKLRVW